MTLTWIVIVRCKYIFICLLPLRCTLIYHKSSMFDTLPTLEWTQFKVFWGSDGENSDGEEISATVTMLDGLLKSCERNPTTPLRPLQIMGLPTTTLTVYQFELHYFSNFANFPFTLSTYHDQHIRAANCRVVSKVNGRPTISTPIEPTLLWRNRDEHWQD